MIAVLSPIHIGGIGVRNVRFFRPPDGGREFPWCSLDDLLGAVAMDRRMRRAFQDDLGNSPWAGATRRIMTPDGRTTVAQHYVCQGLIDAWVTVGRCTSDMYWNYAREGACALSILTDRFRPDELMSYVADAMKAGGGSPA